MLGVSALTVTAFALASQSASTITSLPDTSSTALTLSHLLLVSMQVLVLVQVLLPVSLDYCKKSRVVSESRFQDYTALLRMFDLFFRHGSSTRCSVT